MDPVDDLSTAELVRLSDELVRESRQLLAELDDIVGDGPPVDDDGNQARPSPNTDA